MGIEFMTNTAFKEVVKRNDFKSVLTSYTYKYNLQVI